MPALGADRDAANARETARGRALLGGSTDDKETIDAT
jgi:hypothetical protein